MKPYQHFFLSLLIAVAFAPNSCDRRARDLTFRDLAAGDHKPKVIAAFQPWFGDSSHIRIGYNSNDPTVIHKQIEEAKALGIYAFAVDWYGARHSFLDRSYALIQQIAIEHRRRYGIPANRCGTAPPRYGGEPQAGSADYAGGSDHKLEVYLNLARRLKAEGIEPSTNRGSSW